MSKPTPSSYYDNSRQGMLRHINPEARRVLEVGCGHGNFGRLIKDTQGAHVVGIDISAEAIRVAAENLDQALIIDLDKDPMPFAAAEFDCIVCNDVLEHLIDPWKAVASLSRLLKPNGELIASIPNIRHHKVLRPLIWPGEWRYADIGILDRTHLRFFTRGSIHELIEFGGLHVKTMEGINPRKFPFWLKILNFLSGNALDDMRYVQFAVVGIKPVSTSVS